MIRMARDASAFIGDANVDSGMRCLVHDADWNVCGCYCRDDRHCPTCDEWSSGLHDTPTSCVWCGRPFPSAVKAESDEDFRPILLAVDDCASRYDEFTRMLDRAGIGWAVTCDRALVQALLKMTSPAGEPVVRGILLDHDMPVWDGREWASWIARSSLPQRPVVITSTTGLVGVREEMVRTLDEARVPVLLCPADHADCEKEWLAWFRESADVGGEA